MCRRKNDFTYYAKEQGARYVREDFKTIIDSVFDTISTNELTVCELGFNRAIEFNYIVDRFSKSQSEQPVYFLAYDHREFFHTEYIELPEQELGSHRPIQIHPTPCLFEEIATGECNLPNNIDICYSYRSLTFCDNELLEKLFETIAQSLNKHGFFFGSVNYKTHKAPGFLSKSQLIDCLSSAVSKHDGFNLYISPADMPGEFLFAIEDNSSLHEFLNNNASWNLVR